MDAVGLEAARQTTVVARTFGVIDLGGVAPCRAVELAALSSNVVVQSAVRAPVAPAAASAPSSSSSATSAATSPIATAAAVRNVKTVRSGCCIGDGGFHEFADFGLSLVRLNCTHDLLR